VKQVREVLPQCSEDICCQALVEADEDVMQAVELLLTRPPKPKAKPKAKVNKVDKAEKDKVTNNEKNGHADGRSYETSAAFSSEPNYSGSASSSNVPYYSQQETAEEAVPPQMQQPELPQRPLTSAGKELMKLQKKLREVQKIEQRISAGEKVDQMQMDKLGRKWELKAAERRQEQIVAAEDVQRDKEEAIERENLRKQEEEDARNRAREEEAEREARLQQQQQQQQQQAQLQQQAALEQQQEQQRQQLYAQQAIAQQQQQAAAQQQRLQFMQQAPQASTAPTQGYSSSPYQQQPQQQAVPQYQPPQHIPQVCQQQLQQPAASSRQTHQQVQQPQQQQQQQKPPTYPPQQQRPQAVNNNAEAGATLLAMLHGGRKAPSNHAVQQSTGANVSSNAVQSGEASSYQAVQQSSEAFNDGFGAAGNHGSNDYRKEPRKGRMPGYEDMTRTNPDGKLDESSFMNKYSTPLNPSDFSEEMRARAKAIADEIEGDNGYNKEGSRKGGGKNKGKSSKGEYGSGKGGRYGGSKGAFGGLPPPGHASGNANRETMSRPQQFAVPTMSSDRLNWWN